MRVSLVSVADRRRSAEEHAAIRSVVAALAGLTGASLTIAIVVGAPLGAKLALASMTFLGVAGTLMLSVLELRARRRTPASLLALAPSVSWGGRGGTVSDAGSVDRRDVFISHASEDKEAIARPLAERLRARGCSVWFDDYELVLGDSLRAKIGDGLRHSRVGVVILSNSFFAKRWPRWELDGLTARQLAGEENVILPVLHRIGHDDVRSYSPPLADLVAAKSSDGVEAVADSVVRVLQHRVAGVEPKAALAKARVPSAAPISGWRRLYNFLTTLHGGLTIAAIPVAAAALLIAAHPFNGGGNTSTQGFQAGHVSATTLRKEVDQQLLNIEPRVTVASDLDNNVFALPALESMARGSPLLFVGDLADRGSALKRSLVLRIVKAGRPFVFVSGDYDSDVLERKLARAGAIVLTRSGRLRGDGTTDGNLVTRVRGLRIAGYDDPLMRLARDGYRDNGATPTFAQQVEFTNWLAPLRGKVDIVMVHEPALAATAVDELRRDPPAKPLLLLQGHTHKPSLERHGTLIVLNSGTVELGGHIGLARVTYAASRAFVPVAADLILIDPADGKGRAQRVRLDT
jgi:hypothetical protein